MQKVLLRRKVDTKKFVISSKAKNRFSPVHLVTLKNILRVPPTFRNSDSTFDDF